MAINEFVSAMKDRIRNALVFSILISWVIINYDFLVVILSGESPMHKIQLINNQIYYNGLVKFIHWFFLPVVSGCIYTFAYPYIDISISTFLEQMKVRKAKRMLEISRTTPVAAETQFEYFEGYDREIDMYKQRLQRVIDNRQKEFSKLTREKADLAEKSSRRLLQIFCFGTRISYGNLPLIVEYDTGTYSENKINWQEDYLDFSRKKEFPWLLKLAQESRYRDVSIDDLRLVSVEHITDTCIGATEMERDEYIDLVVALKLVSRFGDNFNIDPLRMDGVIRIYQKVIELEADRPINSGEKNSE